MADRPRRAPRLFVIDDDDFTIELLTGVLESEGYDVTSSTSSTDAMAKVKEARPDCVIVDLMMPGTDGMQLVKQLKEDADLTGTKVIVVSAKLFEFDKRQARKFRADAFIEKPIDATGLLGVVGQILEDKMEVTVLGRAGHPAGGWKTFPALRGKHLLRDPVPATGTNVHIRRGHRHQGTLQRLGRGR